MKRYKVLSLISIIFLFMCEPSNAQDWANLQRYRDDNSKLNPPGPNEKRVVFMGNSITEGWANIMPEFFAGKPYINRAIGGQTSPQMLVRFRQDVVYLHPEVVVILAGTNDIAGNTGPSTLEMIEDNIASMAEIAKANKIKVVLCAVLPVFDYPWKPDLLPAEKIVSLNTWIKTYSAKKGFIYLDYHSKMKDKRNGLQLLYGADGVHPNAAGYKVMAVLAEKAINLALLKK